MNRYAPAIGRGMHTMREAGRTFREIGEAYGVSVDLARRWVARWRWSVRFELVGEGAEQIGVTTHGVGYLRPSLRGERAPSSDVLAHGPHAHPRRVGE